MPYIRVLLSHSLDWPRPEPALAGAVAGFGCHLSQDGSNLKQQQERAALLLLLLQAVTLEDSGHFPARVNTGS